MNSPRRLAFGLVLTASFCLAAESLHAQIFRRGLCRHRFSRCETAPSCCGYDVCCVVPKVVCGTCQITYNVGTRRYEEITSCLNPSQCKCTYPITAFLGTITSACQNQETCAASNDELILAVGTYEGDNDRFPTKTYPFFVGTLMKLQPNKTMTLRLASKQIFAGGLSCDDWWLVEITKLEDETTPQPEPQSQLPTNNENNQDSFSITWQGELWSYNVDRHNPTRIIRNRSFEVKITRQYEHE